MRRAARRDLSEPLIVQAFEAAGCTVFRLDLPVDLLVGWRRQTHLVEIKTPAGKGREGAKKGRMTQLQENFIATWRGEPVSVVWTHEQALQLVREWAE